MHLEHGLSLWTVTVTIFVAGLLAALFVGPSPEPLKDKYCKGWAENNS